ncbi:metallophosphoesterase family protein [Neotabrizicola sp. sgz301269]|uniref:metallophosphoesterase family protein n=1 Tax=Neotabrizicola sp. sgz301269 TaxID=3276282 RepID=UPI00376FDAD5
MRIAVLTDIHANREAFEAVLADLEDRDIGRIAILGDVVGYGPDPVWCVQRVQSLMKTGAVCLRGNHDNAAAGAEESMSQNARKAMDWTLGQLDAGAKAFLGRLPLTVAEGEVQYVHASADAPGDWNYIRNDIRAVPSFRASTARILLCGHVHVPLLVSCDRSGQVRAQSFRSGLPVPLIRSRRWLAVIGAVGQPRDGHAQAGYAILDLDTDELTFRRVAYDVMRTAEKIRAAGLPPDLAQRLMAGE